MKEEKLILTGKRQLTPRVTEMTLEGVTECMRPGQFVNLAVPGFALRRPISVCDLEAGRLRLVVRSGGRGTETLTALPAGQELSVLTGLGNGYDLSRAGTCPVLAGGGVGVPPLYYLARALRQAGLPVTVCLGFNTESELFYEEEFRALGCDVRVATVDGSRGTKGFVTALIPEGSYFYACGPVPMLRSLSRLEMPGEMSLEARMGCGFGACMGCSQRMTGGMRRICREGPVFRKEEILWDD